MTAPLGWLAALVGRADVPAEAPPISHPPVGLTGAEVVARALSVVGQGRYRLGKGGRRPANLTPFDAAGFADCSGFASWSLGLDRYQPGRIAGDWISTDAIVADAQGPGRMFAVAGRLTAAGLDRPAGWQPGDLVVYLAHAALAATDRAAAADVARAGLAAQLELARANVATHQRALAAMAAARDAYQETARVAASLPAPDPAAHGVDQLLAAIDAVAAILPAEPAAGGDRPAGDGGGLPGGAGATGGPDEAVGPATVPES